MLIATTPLFSQPPTASARCAPTSSPRSASSGARAPAPPRLPAGHAISHPALPSARPLTGSPHVPHWRAPLSSLYLLRVAHDRARRARAAPKMKTTTKQQPAKTPAKTPTGITKGTSKATPKTTKAKEDDLSGKTIVVCGSLMWAETEEHSWWISRCIKRRSLAERCWRCVH